MANWRCEGAASSLDSRGSVAGAGGACAGASWRKEGLMRGRNEVNTERSNGSRDPNWTVRTRPAERMGRRAGAYQRPLIKWLHASSGQESSSF